ncbi:MAG: AAA family ATPase [Magnetococcales bacterium]|nr:AAA family ATPase [Magnetococcales bacterium]
MAVIEGLQIKNFRSLRDITLGKPWNLLEVVPLRPMSVVIGKNGVGKSTLFDAFGFLADCLKVGVEEACDARGRGGFEKIRSQGERGPIEFILCYNEGDDAGAITFELIIDTDEHGRPHVLKEQLIQRNDHPQSPIYFLSVHQGEGHVWEKDEVSEQIQGNPNHNMDLFKLSDTRKLAIATLGALTQHPKISSFRRFIEGWYLSYFTPDAARGLPLAGPQKHLNLHGDNLGNVVQFMEREHRERFQKILNRIAKRIPGIDKIDTEKTPDGRVLLRFNDQGFKDPFYAQQMSDGTLKVFAYLLLLEDPSPPPFICIEEPENGLYHKLLETLAREFREHATGQKGGSQVFMTTHQPYLVDALNPDEVWVLEKGADGFSTITRASEIPLVKEMVEQGLPLGGLWYSDYLDAR